jgi:Adipocyte plasma membrane-associated protein-like, N-terminal
MYFSGNTRGDCHSARSSTGFRILCVQVIKMHIYLFHLQNIKFASASEPMELIGPMAPNDLLNGAEKLFEGEIDAPEGLAVYDGELYTGNRQGDVLKILNGKMIKIANIGQKCGKNQMIYQKVKFLSIF